MSAITTQWLYDSYNYGASPLSDQGQHTFTVSTVVWTVVVRSAQSKAVLRDPFTTAVGRSANVAALLVRWVLSGNERVKATATQALSAKRA
jgi:hypothetical protein